MEHTPSTPQGRKCALVTGAGRRIGEAVARRLHRQGYSLGLHYRSRPGEAETLRDALNAKRPGSAILLQAELQQLERLKELVSACHRAFGGLDALINNASLFYATPIAEARPEQWQEMFDSNVRAPFFLVQAAASALAERGGGIVNILDIYAEHPLARHPIYCASKAALTMLTRSLAHDLAPEIRVNGVSPGAILWPESATADTDHGEVLARIPAARRGEPEDIAAAVAYLLDDAPYVTGQILSVDGGRTLAI